MFPQKLDHVESIFTAEETKAIDALSVATACHYSKTKGVLILDAETQEQIQDFWKASFHTLMKKGARNIEFNALTKAAAALGFRLVPME